MTVQRILNSQRDRAITHIAPDAMIVHVLHSPQFEDDGALVVSSDGKTVEGIISERDIACGLRAIGPDLLNRLVRELMTTKVLTCTPEDRAAGIMALMVSRQLRYLPVVKDGHLVGMVSIHDLLQLRLDEVQSDAEAMRSYITGSA